MSENNENSVDINITPAGSAVQIQNVDPVTHRGAEDNALHIARRTAVPSFKLRNFDFKRINSKGIMAAKYKRLGAKLKILNNKIEHHFLEIEEKAEEYYDLINDRMAMVTALRRIVKDTEAERFAIYGMDADPEEPENQ